VRLAAIGAAALLLLGACREGPRGAADSGSGNEVLEILVTNDDGYDAPGIDAVVAALRALPDTKVTVVAPARNESGSGDDTTRAPHETRRTETAGGFDATAVKGEPADAVNTALDELGLEPDVVVSGANRGANLGPVTEVSGTVGAARTAARRGIPALAASTGTSHEPDYAGTAALVVRWIRQHRHDLLSGDEPHAVTSLNVPSCAPGEHRRGSVVERTAKDDDERDTDDVDCGSTRPASRFRDDIDAFVNGYAVFAPVSLH